jgi:ferredoxin
MERLFQGGGWVQVLLTGIYASILSYMMQDPDRSAIWRRRSWLFFSIVFFSQLFLGLAVSEVFLMTGKLHLPLPFMILSGPLYRGELSVMSILFLSTVVLSGPAWCSHICYFGGIDNQLASRKKSARGFPSKFRIRYTLLIVVIAVTLLLRYFGASYAISLVFALAFGIGGIILMAYLSPRRGRMAHCTLWCPVGALVSGLKPVNPFRFYIDQNCDQCFRCTLKCPYDALRKENILAGKPGSTCTYCGDCISSCHTGSLRYKFFKMKPENARKLFLLLSISLHTLSLCLARI